MHEFFLPFSRAVGLHFFFGGGVDRRDVLDLMHGRIRMTIRHSHPYNAGAEHVRSSPTRQTFACTMREAP